jgi:hypothetical protein
VRFNRSVPSGVIVFFTNFNVVLLDWLEVELGVDAVDWQAALRECRFDFFDGLVDDWRVALADVDSHRQDAADQPEKRRGVLLCGPLEVADLRSPFDMSASLLPMFSPARMIARFASSR